LLEVEASSPRACHAPQQPVGFDSDARVSLRLRGLLLFLHFSTVAPLAGTALITIDASRAGPAINPHLYGIFSGGD
jgi:hypothetical protein